MVKNSELLSVPVFAGLPDDQISWFISQAIDLPLKAGETYFREGDPADAMFVVLEGQLQVRGELGGETVVIAIKAGDVTGVLPFSRMKQFTVGTRAVTDARVLRFPSSLFPELVQKMPELTQRLVGLMSDRIRETTRREQQRDRLVSLGKLWPVSPTNSIIRPPRPNAPRASCATCSRKSATQATNSGGAR